MLDAQKDGLKMAADRRQANTQLDIQAANILSNKTKE